MNSFCVIFHMLDSEGSEDTLRYKMGQISYFTFFFLQTVALIGTYTFAWIIYIRLAIFLKPRKRSINEIGEEVSEDELYENFN